MPVGLFGLARNTTLVFGVTARENGVDVGGVVLLRRDHGLGAGAERGDRVHQKAVRGMNRLVAIGQIGARDQVEQVVGAGAANDARRIEAEDAADRFAQRRDEPSG